MSEDGNGGRNKETSRTARVIRLAVFLLCPVYIVWSLKMGSGNILAWPGSEIGAFVVLTLLWCAAWGFAALAHVRRARIARRHYQQLEEQTKQGRDDEEQG